MLLRFRNGLLLWTLAGYLIFNYGFMQLRIPPSGAGIPIGELVLIICLFSLRLRETLPRLKLAINLIPFLLWLVFSLGHAMLGLPEHGLWALRDATHALESLFLVVGFLYCARPDQTERLFRWLPRILCVATVYFLGYPFSAQLQSLSPSIEAGAGHLVPLLFNYSGTALMLLLAASYLILNNPWRIPTFMKLLVLGLLIGMPVALFQNRTIYLQFICLFGIIFLFRQDRIGRVSWAMILLLCLVLMLPILGLEIRGRLGQTVSLEFIGRHLLAIGGVESEGLRGAAAGVPQRLGWWMDIFNRWAETPATFLFGLGYGFPLIDFSSTGDVTVREPHNSFISILARSGMVSFAAFAMFQVLLLRAWFFSYRRCGALGLRLWQNRLILLLLFSVMIQVNALGEDAFEKPYYAIPYYLFWGVVLRVCYNLKSGNQHLLLSPGRPPVPGRRSGRSP